MKWHQNLISEVVKALYEIFNLHKQGDKVIQNLLKSQKKWGSRDRRLVSQILYDIIRWKRLYESLSGHNMETEQGKWEAIAVWAILNKIDLPSWEVFSHLKTDEILQKYHTIGDERIKQSVPDWLFELGQNQIGERWATELKSLNTEAPVTLRVNRLKTTPEELKQILYKQNIETHTHPSYPEALFLTKRQKLTHLPAYKQGLFEVQDASSQLVAPFTEAKPGQTIIDACAGAGGKTLHLAAQMQNQGQILAYDIFSSKIDELKRRAKRNGVKNIVETGVINRQIVEKNKHKADILLLDAPCSSLGTLRRKPDLKWKLNPGKLQKINLIQKDILAEYEKMLQPGGTLIYVTCSILPQENEEIVKNFLQKHKNYTFVAEQTIWPSKNLGDGFYMAKLLKQTNK